MHGRHIFVVFKLGRTGSSRLAQLINAHPDCYCLPEILNCLARGNAEELSQQCVEGRLECRSERNIGFTLNPGKQAVGPGFFDYRRKFSDRRLLVFLLSREDILAQALSLFVSREAGAYPGGRSLGGADRVIRLIEGGVRVPIDDLQSLIQRIRKRSKECRKIAAGFAARFDVPCREITYERLYGEGHEGLIELFELMDVRDDIPLPDQSEKLLPPPEQYVLNYDEVMATARRLVA